MRKSSSDSARRARPSLARFVTRTARQSGLFDTRTREWGAVGAASVSHRARSPGGTRTGTRPRRCSFRKFLDHPGVECGNVIGLAARDQPRLNDNLFVSPLCGGVDQIRSDGWPRGDGTSFHHTRVDQRPRAVTNYRYRLARLEKAAHKLKSRG